MTTPTEPLVALDLFAGAGGWDVGCRRLGVEVHGVEIMPEAVATREANGFSTVFRDVWDGLFMPALMPNYQLLIASPPCFTAGAPVLTRRGMVVIEQVEVGDEVLTHKGRWRKVTATMNRMAETVTFHGITCTPDHPFYAARQWRKWRTTPTRGYDWGVGEPEWINAEDTQGVFLSIPTTTESTVEHESPLSWWLVGRWLADGWGQPVRHEVAVAVSAGKAEEFLEKSGETWRTYAGASGSVERYVLHNRRAIEWLTGHFGSSAAGKTIPGWVLDLPEGDRRDLLEGYLSGDGTQTASGRKANTVSINLAFGIKLLAESLGYTTNYTLVRTPDTTVIEGRTVNQRDYWGIAIHEDDGRYSRRTDMHRWVKQRKPVVPSGVQRVYDLTVEEDHSFTCWGYVVHNCQGYSMAGKGSGRKALDDVLKMIAAEAYKRPEVLRDYSSHGVDDRDVLVLTPLAYIWRDMPDFVALEQVPAVLPVWEAYGDVMRAWGYTVDTGLLHAEQYGVPQTRKRAILVARRDSVLASLPTPTHSRYHSRTPERLDAGVHKWVSMYEALRAVHGGERGVLVSNYGTGGDPRNRGVRSSGQPAGAVTSKADRSKWDGEVKMDADEAAALQSFPTGWGFTDRPAPTVHGKPEYTRSTSGQKNMVGAGIDSGSFQPRLPFDADTIKRDNRTDDRYGVAFEKRYHKEGVNMVPEEAAVLQSFPSAVKNMGAGMVERHGERPGRAADQPAFTVRAAAGGGEPGGFKWSDGEKLAPEDAAIFQSFPADVVLRNGNQANSAKRDPDAPAPTMHFGQRSNKVEWMDSALAEDPGASGARVTPEEASTFQSFPAGWGLTDRPAPTFCNSGNGGAGIEWGGNSVRKKMRGQSATGDGWAAKPDVEPGTNDAIRLAVGDAAALQSFPDEPPFQWRGSKTKQFLQIGNAVPPLLATHVLERLLFDRQDIARTYELSRLRIGEVVRVA